MQFRASLFKMYFPGLFAGLFKMYYTDLTVLI
jgi:hypothetical protein